MVPKQKEENAKKSEPGITAWSRFQKDLKYGWLWIGM